MAIAQRPGTTTPLGSGDIQLPERASSAVALVLVTIAISYLSLVFGELVPKRLALQRAEIFALALGPTINRVSLLSRPVIWLLSKSTNAVVRMLGSDPDGDPLRIELVPYDHDGDPLVAARSYLVTDVSSVGVWTRGPATQSLTGSPKTIRARSACVTPAGGSRSPRTTRAVRARTTCESCGAWASGRRSATS